MAAAASFCLSRLLGRLLQFESDAGAFAPLDELDAILQHARFATAVSELAADRDALRAGGVDSAEQLLRDGGAKSAFKLPTLAEAA